MHTVFYVLREQVIAEVDCTQLLLKQPLIFKMWGTCALRMKNYTCNKRNYLSLKCIKLQTALGFKVKKVKINLTEENLSWAHVRASHTTNSIRSNSYYFERKKKLKFHSCPSPHNYHPPNFEASTIRILRRGALTSQIIHFNISPYIHYSPEYIHIITTTAYQVIWFCYVYRFSTEEIFRKETA